MRLILWRLMTVAALATSLSGCWWGPRGRGPDGPRRDERRDERRDHHDEHWREGPR